MPRPRLGKCFEYTIIEFMFCIIKLYLALGVVLCTVGAETVPTYEVPQPALSSAAISHGEGAKQSLIFSELLLNNY